MRKRSRLSYITVSLLAASYAVWGTFCILVRVEGAEEYAFGTLWGSWLFYSCTFVAVMTALIQGNARRFHTFIFILWLLSPLFWLLML